VGFEYRFTPTWAVRGTYDYRRQKRDLEGTGSSNQVVVSVAWQPPRRP
jgi:opacity protein-like surface antigen